MAASRLDCRGLACPSPVLKTKELIDQGNVDQLTVLVDNPAAQENVSRFLTRSGYQLQVEESDGAIAITGFRDKSETCQLPLQQAPQPASESKIMVLLGVNYLGRGDDELGRKLVISFIKTLKEMGRELWRLVLLNSGVKLATEGSEVLASLQELENDGVTILVCGTCLDHFHLLDKKQVGETTNMLDIVTSMQLADKVISLT
ncbi:MAG: sulfurtransferase-like selenium metabolism protein YedF [Deltaproteobacteria bacterium]|nr:sulfurtransferase-like selenium metabolism protein YedF [Deltaproteobacteria bacterium]MBW1953185.1 sulfurtransferase-like selenium metabolism protein YedF [Deltaproteobacteria bacterium]MBW1985991.1 sulfurtransferase-like selenium metabolism protein YedF [Deltaproteobacteria bacterium]MBW2134847.1 sulfurtransferase-like selenium metabolism protein YedF [Deltaproteobacteria bacterium]